jgi:hypothetical protein
MAKAPFSSETPNVGIFWGIEALGKVRVPAIDRTALAMAEPYGEALTHPRGHYEVWEAWKRLGAAGLTRRGLPSAIAYSEYDEHPRGRIVYHTTRETFTVYADKRLQTAAFLTSIIAAFFLPIARTTIRSDGHYRST